MTVFLLAMLVGMWGIVFAPSLLKARQHSSPVASVSTFNRSLQALGSGQITTGGRWVVMPPSPSTPGPASRSPAIERRRRLFTILVGVCVVTLCLGLLPGLRLLLWVHLLADLCLAAMVGLLVSIRAMSAPAPRRDAIGTQPGPGRVSYAANHPGRFEPAGHGYRMTAELRPNPFAPLPRQGDPPSIKVYRSDDPPSMRLTRRPGSLTEGSRPLEDHHLIRVGSPSMAPEQKPKMFIEDEDEDGFLQAQGL